MPNRDHANANDERARAPLNSRDKRAARGQDSGAGEHTVRWPRAEGYARQRTDLGHQHESVFGEPEGAPEDSDAPLNTEEDTKLPG